MLKFLKNWTLPLAMFAGAIGYFLLANVTILEPAKPFVNWLIAVLTPFLIFAQLLLTFCKIEPKELLPKAWHVWLLSIQAVSSGIIALLLIFCPMEEAYRDIFEGAMVCLICPTATAAAVITGKLGGSASTLTTYTLLSNVLAAIAVPLVFPLVEPHADITFVVAFLKILSKVFPLLLGSFFYCIVVSLLYPVCTSTVVEISWGRFLFVGGCTDYCDRTNRALTGYRCCRCFHRDNDCFGRTCHLLSAILFW